MTRHDPNHMIVILKDHVPWELKGKMRVGYEQLTKMKGKPYGEFRDIAGTKITPDTRPFSPSTVIRHAIENGYARLISFTLSDGPEGLRTASMTKSGNNWTSLLEQVIPTPCFERPFVCDGFPSASDVIVIGENPATQLENDWWSYWNRSMGFNYEAFLAYYMNERNQLGKRVSNTRLRLNRIRDNGISCIETNAYKNEKPDGVGDGVSNHGVLDTIIPNVDNLRAIIAHGKVAQKFLARSSLPASIKVYETPHFRSISYDEIDRICMEIKSSADLTISTVDNNNNSRSTSGDRDQIKPLWVTNWLEYQVEAVKNEGNPFKFNSKRWKRHELLIKYHDKLPIREYNRLLTRSNLPPLSKKYLLAAFNHKCVSVLDCGGQPVAIKNLLEILK